MDHARFVLHPWHLHGVPSTSQGKRRTRCCVVHLPDRTDTKRLVGCVSHTVVVALPNRTDVIGSVGVGGYLPPPPPGSSGGKSQ
jgi:hypothetical protein